MPDEPPSPEKIEELDPALLKMAESHLRKPEREETKTANNSICLIHFIGYAHEKNAVSGRDLKVRIKSVRLFLNLSIAIPLIFCWIS